MTSLLNVWNKPSSMLIMHEVDTGPFGHLDIKTLSLLAKLLETASVTRTAEAFAMSQPAASRAVERLRRVIGDPLLVRTRKGYVLTARAAELAPVVDAALASLSRVFTGQAFEPALTRQRFRVATTDYGAVAVVAPLMTSLLNIAPQAAVDVTMWSDDTLDRLETGRCDLALYADSDLPADFHSRELFIESYALLLRRAHPALKGLGVRVPHYKAVLTAVADCPHAVIMFPDGRQMAADNVLERLGYQKTPSSFRTPYFMSAPWVIADTNLIMCVPTRIAGRMAAAAKLAMVPLPASIEAFPYRMIWHARAHRNPAHVWLRGVMLRSCTPHRSDVAR